MFLVVKLKTCLLASRRSITPGLGCGGVVARSASSAGSCAAGHDAPPLVSVSALDIAIDLLFDGGDCQLTKKDSKF